MKKLVLSEMISDVITGDWGSEPKETSFIKVLRTTNFTNEGKLDLTKEVVIRDIDIKKFEKKKLKYGDVIIEKSGGTPTQPVGRVVFFDQNEDDYVCNNFTSILRPKKGIVGKYLLYGMYYLHFLGKTLKYQNKTTGIINLKLDNYLNGESLFAPEFELQRRIVSTLDTADFLIQKRKEVITKLDQLIQSVFFEMFGDPVTNTYNWDVRDFDYFAKIDTNMIKDFTNYQDYLHVGIDNIEKETGKIINCKPVKEENLISGKYLFTDNHIIYSKIRPYLNKVALPNFYGLCSADAYPILVDDKITNRYYYAYILRSKAFLNYILQHSERTNIPKVNKTQLQSFKTICPPRNLQEKFKERVISIEKEREKMERQLTKLEENFKSLLHLAFTGQLQLKEEKVNDYAIKR